MLIIFQTIIILISLFGFTQQLFQLRRQKILGSFSIFIPGIILIISILKIFFWFIQPFAFSLIVQCLLLIVVSVNMIFTQLLLLKQCIVLRKQKIIYDKHFLLNFWNWETFQQYIIFLFGFSAALAVLTYISVSYKLPIIGQIFAYISTVVEIYLAIPQIYSSFKRKSVEGVSKVMIAMWIINDTLKTGYFIYNSQPIQFILTGSAQMVLDIVLIAQLMAYRRRAQTIQNQKHK